MLADGKKQFAVGDVVVVSDLSISKRQQLYPVLGIIQKFMDPLHAQAVVLDGQ